MNKKKQYYYYYNADNNRIERCGESRIEWGVRYRPEGREKVYNRLKSQWSYSYVSETLEGLIEKYNKPIDLAVVKYKETSEKVFKRMESRKLSKSDYKKK